MLIQDTYYVSVFIDGKDLFEEFPCELISADIYEGIEDIIPTCVLKLSMAAGALTQLPFVDGSKIEFIIYSDAFNINRKCVFRLYNIEELQQTNYIAIVTLSGILDFYEGYLQGNTFNSFNTTSEVFTNICNTYGLINDIDKTDDQQLWIAGENNLYKFMTYITQHAYIDETSAMFWCFDAEKKLLFKNIINLFKTNINNTYTFIQGDLYDSENKIYRYLNSEANVMSGKNNLLNQGYGGNDYYFNLLEYKLKEANSKFVIAENRMINISKELSKGLANEMMPFDIGNFHKKYFDADKQNRRTLSTFSTNVLLETDCLQSFKLAEIVKLSFRDIYESDSIISALCGNYIISNIRTSISRVAVTASLRLTAQGLNTISSEVETY